MLPGRSQAREMHCGARVDETLRGNSSRRPEVQPWPLPNGLPSRLRWPPRSSFTTRGGSRSSAGSTSTWRTERRWAAWSSAPPRRHAGIIGDRDLLQRAPAELSPPGASSGPPRPGSRPSRNNIIPFRRKPALQCSSFQSSGIFESRRSCCRRQSRPSLSASRRSQATGRWIAGTTGCRAIR